METHVQVQAFMKMQHNKARQKLDPVTLCLCTARPRCCKQKSLGAGKCYAPRRSHKHHQKGEKHSETWRTCMQSMDITRPNMSTLDKKCEKWED